ncbi:unnamed protein product [Prunus armeniaca]|uniref:Uncharacterized protein n=1 Tax=Prunus armeniaca TaxID=36596 RepID=A0A6J5Y4F4_PRUAR|nr:unnamed protein product [Prunus armeniaca]CAB4319422.1 unnamed protein product [Prunus armeniaca]
MRGSSHWHLYAVQSNEEMERKTTMKTTHHIGAELEAVSRVVGLGRSSKRYCLVPPRGRIKRRILALLFKRLKLATQHSLKSVKGFKR